MRRALVLMGHPGHGGIMRSLGVLARGAQRHGWSLRCVFPHPDEQVVSSGLAEGSCYVGGVHRWRRAGARVAAPYVLARLLREIRRDRARVVYSATLATLPYAILAARLAGIEEIVHVYSSYDGVRPYRKHWLRRARHAIAPSEDSLTRAGAAIGGFAGEACVVYNGVDIDHIRAQAALPASLAVSGVDGGPLVGMVANLDRRKNPMALVEAAARIIPSAPGTRILLVGTFPEPAYQEAVLARARSLGVDGHLVFAGYQANPFPLMAACDVIALPTLRDPFPIALLEAMALAKPVVATSVGGIPEMLVDGESGFVVPPGDVDALAARLLVLLQERSRRTTMGLAARHRLETSFSLDGFVRNMFAAFDAAVDG